MIISIPAESEQIDVVVENLFSVLGVADHVVPSAEVSLKLDAEEEVVSHLIRTASSLPSPKEIRDAVFKSAVSKGAEQQKSATSVFLKEVIYAMNQARLQIEHDLKIISDAMQTDHCLEKPVQNPQATSEDVAFQSPSLQHRVSLTDLSKTEMEKLVTQKSRSMKQFSDKKKHMRNKILGFVLLDLEIEDQLNYFLDLSFVCYY